MTTTPVAGPSSRDDADTDAPGPGLGSARSARPEPIGGRAGDRRRWALRAGAGLLAVGVIAGCSSTAESSSVQPAASQDGAAADTEAVPGGEPRSGVEAPAERTAADGTAVTDDLAAVTAGSQRKVSRAQVVVTVDDLSAASATVRELAPAHGGYVSSESVAVTESSAVDNGYVSSSSSYQPDRADNSSYPTTVGGVGAQPGEARIVLRVAPDRTEVVMSAVAAVGEESSRWRSDTDVELTLVDLDSRIATQTQSIADLRVLMSKATTIGEIITVEQEISTRTANLESLKAQQASLADAASYSTVTAVLRTPERSEAAATEAGFLGGLAAGWAALVRSLTALLTVVGAVLPFAVLAVLLWYPAQRWLRPRLARRLQRRRDAQAARLAAQQAPPQQWQFAAAGSRGPGAAGPGQPSAPQTVGRPAGPAGQSTGGSGASGGRGSSAPDDGGDGPADSDR